MSRSMLAVVVLLAACGSPQEAGDTSTTAAEPTSTISAGTSSEPSSTTSAPTTTQNSTTTTVTTTSTTQLLAGDWADQPLVVAEFGALGWWDGSEWVRAEEVGALPVTGGEDYQVSLLAEGSTTSGGAQEIVCDPPGNLGVRLEDPDRLGTWPGPFGVAVSAEWSIHPHLLQSFADDDGSYAEFARELLASRGLDVPDPVIKQLYRTDLEGDGTNEVLVVAEEVSEGLFGQVGDYSIIFMRKVVQGEVQTAIIDDSIITDPEAFLLSFSLGSVADLNGDGKMEIVVDSAYYEGLGVEIWEYVDDDLGLVPRLSVGCGA